MDFDGGVMDFVNVGSSLGEGDRPLLEPAGERGSVRFSSGKSSC